MSGVGESGLAIAVTGLLWQIGKAGVNVKRYKKKCRELQRDCQRMQGVIDANKDALTASAIAPDVQSCLTEVNVFVNQCTKDWSYLHIGWEAVIEKKFPSLRDKLSELVKTLMLESVVAHRKEQQQSDEQIKALKISLSSLTVTISTQYNEDVREREVDRQKRKEITDTLLSEIRVQGTGRQSFKVTFSDPDPDNPHQSLKELALLDPSDPEGDLTGVLQGVRKITCKRLKEARPELQSRIPKPARVYELLAESTRVQRYFGLLQRGEAYYAVMEDLRSFESIGKWTERHSRPPRIQALQWSYAIASTVAYFHSVQLLLKTLSDETIILKRTEDVVDPILTELQRARMIWEPTVRVSYDVRYEAPEYLAQKDHGGHTKYTDIWSLGVIIWQCFTAKYPFDCPSQALVSSVSGPGKKMAITHHLSQGAHPWASDTQIAADVLELVQSCCLENPVSRPTASEVAGRLLDLLTIEASASVVSASVAVSHMLEPKLEAQILVMISKRRDAADKAQRSKKPLPKPEGTISEQQFFHLSRAASARDDPNIYFLIGAAIWWELVDVDNIKEYQERFSDMVHLSPQEKKAHRALAYLQPAVDRGLDNACMETSAAYKILSQIHEGRLNVSKVLTGEGQSK